MKTSSAHIGHMKTNTRTIRVGCGRGGNPASQNNIKPQRAEYFVMVQGDLGLWSVLFGPMQKGKAHATDNKMRALGSRTAVCNRENAIEHDAIGVAQNEAKRGAK